MILQEQGVSAAEAQILDGFCQEAQDFNQREVNQFNEMSKDIGYDRYPVKMYSTSQTKQVGKIDNEKVCRFFHLINALEDVQLRKLYLMTIGRANGVGLVPPPLPPKIGG